MSGGTTTATRRPKPAIGVVERYLSVWVALCIVAGILLGRAVPGVFEVLGDATVAQVNLPVALLVWLMIVPMLVKVDPAALGAALATVVGVLVEVPVMLPVVQIVRRSRGWYERGAGV